MKGSGIKPAKFRDGQKVRILVGQQKGRVATVRSRYRSVERDGRKAYVLNDRGLTPMYWEDELEAVQ